MAVSQIHNTEEGMTVTTTGRFAGIYYRSARQNQSQTGAATKTNYKDAGSPIKSGMTERAGRISLA